MIFFPSGEKTEAGIKTATRLVLKFVVVGMAWIIISDVYLFFDQDNVFAKLTHLHIVKGILFIAICSVFLFCLILSHHRSLCEKEDEITALFYNNPIPTCFLDEASLKILAVNPAACHAFDYAQVQMLRMKITDLSDENDSSILRKTILEKDNPFSCRVIFSFKTRTGSIVQARIFSAHARFKGKKACFISILDMTSQLKAEKELEIMDVALKEHLAQEKEALVRYNQELVYRLRQSETVNEELIYVNEELQKANRRLAEQNGIQVMRSKGIDKEKKVGP